MVVKLSYLLFTCIVTDGWVFNTLTSTFQLLV